MKIAIIGSRGFKDVQRIRDHIRRLSVSVHKIEHTNNDDDPLTLVSGGAVGVDSEVRCWAAFYQIPLIEYKPNYAKYGKAATHVRNDQIIEKADKVFAYWDGTSPGTRSVIQKCLERKKDISVIFDR